MRERSSLSFSFRPKGDRYRRDYRFAVSIGRAVVASTYPGGFPCFDSTFSQPLSPPTTSKIVPRFRFATTGYPIPAPPRTYVSLVASYLPSVTAAVVSFSSPVAGRTEPISMYPGGLPTLDTMSNQSPSHPTTFTFEFWPICPMVRNCAPGPTRTRVLWVTTYGLTCLAMSGRSFGSLPRLHAPKVKPRKRNVIQRDGRECAFRMSPSPESSAVSYSPT